MGAKSGTNFCVDALKNFGLDLRISGDHGKNRPRDRDDFALLRLELDIARS